MGNCLAFSKGQNIKHNDGSKPITDPNVGNNQIPSSNTNDQTEPIMEPIAYTESLVINKKVFEIIKNSLISNYPNIKIKEKKESGIYEVKFDKNSCNPKKLEEIQLMVDSFVFSMVKNDSCIGDIKFSNLQKSCFSYSRIKYLNFNSFIEFRRDINQPFLEKEVLNFINDISSKFIEMENNSRPFQLITPDNISMKIEPKEDGAIKKISYFINKRTSDLNKIDFIPPETFHQHSDVKEAKDLADSDMFSEKFKKGNVWAFGMILYWIFKISSPFWNRSDQQKIIDIKKGQFEFEIPGISESIKKIVKDMLNTDEQSRIKFNSVRDIAYTLIQCKL